MKIPRLSAQRTDLPADLERVVMKALERNRRRRFATAADMARALDEVVVGAKLHVDEVAAFVREIEAISPLGRQPLPDGVALRWAAGAPGNDPAGEGPTVPDPALRLRMWRARSPRPRLAAAIGLALAMLGLGTAFGLRLSTPAARSTAAELAR
jgi:hypothetical protein